jgi:hypothetical protein
MIVNGGCFSPRCSISARCTSRHARWVTRSGALVGKLRGDYEAVFFGGMDRDEDRGLPPVPEYPADETDEA